MLHAILSWQLTKTQSTNGRDAAFVGQVMSEFVARMRIQRARVGRNDNNIVFYNNKLWFVMCVCHGSIETGVI